MELFMNLMYILVTSVLVENVVLAKFLGCCPFLGVSKKSGAVALLLGLVELLKDCLIQSGKVGRREGVFLVVSFCVTGKRVLAAGQAGKGICLLADVLDSVLPKQKLFKLLVDQMKVVIQRVLQRLRLMF